jgi:hypothetical protein
LTVFSKFQGGLSQQIGGNIRGYGPCNRVEFLPQLRFAEGAVNSTAVFVVYEPRGYLTGMKVIVVIAPITFCCHATKFSLFPQIYQPPVELFLTHGGQPPLARFDKGNV